MFWATSIGVGVVAIGTAVTAYQTYLTQRALTLSLQQQRAWIKIEAQPVNAVILDKSGGDLAIAPTLTNVGSIPAFSAVTSAKLIPAANPRESHRHPRDVSRDVLDVCDVGSPNSTGLNVFPGQALKEDYALAHISPRNLRAMVDSKNRVGLILLVCVTYRSGADPKFHKVVTSFMLEDTSRASTGADSLLFDVGGDVTEAKNLALRPFTAQNSAD